MEPAITPVDEKHVEAALGNLLRGGVLLAAAVVSAGGIYYLGEFGSQKPQNRVFHGEDLELCTIPGIIADALRLDSRGIIQFGLLLLIATPILRVVFSVFAFASQKDYTYVLITLLVLVVLLYSFSGGHL